MENVSVYTPKRKKLIRNKKEFLFNVFKYALCVVWLVICIFPFYYSILTALKNREEIMFFSLIVKNPTLDNFKRAFQSPDMMMGVLNTLFVTVAGMAINILVSLLAGYSFARLNFKGKRLVFKIMEASMMLPFAVVFIPTFIVLAKFPLIGGNNLFGQGGYGFVGFDTRFLGIILPSCISVYNIFFLKQFFVTLPNEFGESAKLDGAGHFRIFYHIYLPLILPAVATLAIFTFQAGWNNYFWPNIIGQGQFKVATIVLRSFYTAVPVDHGAGMAAALIFLVPMLILFFACQRFFMSGISAGGVKS